MSVVFGMVHLDGRPADRGELARLGAVSPAPEGESHWVEGPAALGHMYSRVTPESLAERQPCVEGGVAVSFDGRLDNRDDLAGAYGVSRDAPDPALVLAAYRQDGERCIDRLVGDFAFALFDARERRLMLARDIMAGRPLYYAVLPTRVLFASQVKLLLAEPGLAAAPDLDGLADLLLNGYSDGHTSCFAGIRLVPPGSVVAATPDRVTVTRCAELTPSAIGYARADEYVEHFRALFGQAVKRRLRSAHPVAVAVSGGLDSSAIHAQAARLADVPVRGVTMAFPRGSAADESDYIQALRREGLHVEDVRVQSVHWAISPERTAARMEMPALLWEEQDRMLARARAAGCRVLLNGFFGDQMLGGDAYLIDLLRRGRFGVVRRHLRERAAWMIDVDPVVLRRYFFRTAAAALAPAWAARAVRVARTRLGSSPRYAPWFTRDLRDRARQRARDRALRPHRFDSAHAEDCWRLATSGFYTAGLSQLWSIGAAHRLETTYPFRDRDLVSFLMAVPGDVVCEGGVPKALLRRSLDGLLPERIRLRRSKGDGTPFSNGAARAAEPAMRRLLGADSVSARAGLVDPRILSAEMPRIFGSGLSRGDSAVLGWQVGDTLGLELWMRHFCAGTTCN